MCINAFKRLVIAQVTANPYMNYRRLGERTAKYLYIQNLSNGKKRVYQLRHRSKQRNDIY